VCVRERERDRKRLACKTDIECGEIVWVSSQCGWEKKPNKKQMD